MQVEVGANQQSRLYKLWLCLIFLQPQIRRWTTDFLCGRIRPFSKIFQFHQIADQSALLTLNHRFIELSRKKSSGRICTTPKNINTYMKKKPRTKRRAASVRELPRKNKQITCWLDFRELELLKAASKQAKVSASSFIRRSVLRVAELVTGRRIESWKFSTNSKGCLRSCRKKKVIYQMIRLNFWSVKC